jgi:hypothetical protein
VHLEVKGRIIITKAVGPLQNLICKKIKHQFKTMTEDIWCGVPDLLRKSFKARILEKEDKEAMLKADPLIDVRNLLLEMKMNHGT